MSLPPGQRVLLEKAGQWSDRTESIRGLRRTGKMVSITFTDGRTFNYGEARVATVGNAVKLLPLPIVHDKIARKQLRVASVEQWQDTKIRQVWFRIHPMCGRPLWRLPHQVDLQENALAKGGPNSVRTYLEELADAVHNGDAGGGAAANEGAAGLALRPKLERLPAAPKGSVLGSFLTGAPLGNSHAQSRQVIAPWATNLSQLSALHAANSAPVSVIQGPPGTGKTQTILALIANALVRGESVAVVSSNNTAVDNVKTKLDDAGLGFLTARLGSQDHREEFVAQQQAQIPAEVLGWAAAGTSHFELAEQAARTVHELRAGLVAGNEIAQLRQELRDVGAEAKHFGQTSAAETDLADQLEKVAARYTSSGFLQEVLRLEQQADPPWRRLFSWFAPRRRTLRRLLRSVSAEQRREIWYQKRIVELDIAIGQRQGFLASIGWDSLRERAQSQSLQALRAAVASRRAGKLERAQFSAKLWGQEAEFLREYPVVFSTMQSLPGTFKPDFQFDWVIVDEASQANLLTGILAMSCARRIVVVGDEQQLPRVLPRSDATHAQTVEDRHRTLLTKAPWLSYVKHSFLGATIARWGTDVPVTLLREHYRCAPLIAGFINQRFYGGQLQIMTKDDAAHPMPITVTLGRGKSWDHINRHQVEEVAEQLTSGVGEPQEVGVIAPYRNQVGAVRERIVEIDPTEVIEVDTVHAYQGREKPVIILTTVAGSGDFVNDPRLVNVAVSRAQKRLVLVADQPDAFSPGLIGDLIRYVGYHDLDAIRLSKVRSVFELLAAAQAPLLMELRAARGAAARTESPAESIMADLLSRLLSETEFETLAFIQEYALLDLVGSGYLTDPERRLAERGSRVDFLIYDTLDKKPAGVIEVDGASFHRRASAQDQRDQLKNSALKRAGIPLLRLRTDGAGELAKVREFLMRALTDRSPDRPTESDAPHGGTVHTIPHG